MDKLIIIVSERTKWMMILTPPPKGKSLDDGAIGYDGSADVEDDAKRMTYNSAEQN
jgi:hypothetical protein